MRKANVKRNKSCGCLKRDTFHAFVAERRRQYEARSHTPPPSSWAQHDELTIGPALTIVKVLGRPLTRYGIDHP